MRPLELFFTNDGKLTLESVHCSEQNLGLGTPGFEKWFFGSKVAYESGDPLVVYHGSDSEIAVFDCSRNNGGFWFSEDPSDAHSYGSKTTNAYLSIKNPAYFERTNGDDGLNVAITSARRAGHDGLIVTAPEEGDASGMYWPTNYVAFDPAQIKIVTGNS